MLDDHMKSLLLYLVSTGIFGGLTNYYLTITNNKKIDEVLLFKSILTGIAAALCIPLFLNMISSTLIQTSKENSNHLLIIVGFGLIASIFSQQFLNKLRDELLNKVKEVKEKVDTLEERSYEPVINENDTESTNSDNLTELEKNIIDSMYNPRWRYRSLSGLMKETKLKEKSTTDIINSLNSLLVKELVQKENTPKGVFWGLTEKGYNKVVIRIASELCRDK